MPECCERQGAWKFCPWCGAAWVPPAGAARRPLVIKEIAALARQGLTYKQIGAALGYSAASICSYVGMEQAHWRGEKRRRGEKYPLRRMPRQWLVETEHDA